MSPVNSRDSYNKSHHKCDKTERDTLVMPWVNAQVAYLLAGQWVTATIEDDKPGSQTLVTMMK